jgi:hypothetical protein
MSKTNQIINQKRRLIPNTGLLKKMLNKLKNVRL